MIFLRFVLLIAVMAAGAKLAVTFGLTDVNLLLKLAFGVVWGAAACFVLLYRAVPGPFRGASDAPEEVVEELSDADIEELLLTPPPLPAKSESLRAVRG